MKRSGAPKRRKGLERNTPMVNKTSFQRKTEMPRGNGFKRGANPPKKNGRKGRPKTAPKTAIDLAKVRSEGLCEIGLKCFGTAPAVESAHRRGKGSGGVGPKNTTSNTASNLLRGCVACHDFIDNVAPDDAARLGLKVLHGKAHPYEIPVQHYQHGWVLLDNFGGWRAAPEAACTPGALLPVIVCGPWDLLTGGGAVAEVLDRFGHADCCGWAGARDGLLVCGCRSVVCAVEEAS
ncbi:hypothetical protein [Streptomyces sp.]|uniref:hypothetical protein n=1 Tax=Streptomyces sp. TaxID=1931 RepID=UPI002F951420